MILSYQFGNTYVAEFSQWKIYPWKVVAQFLDTVAKQPNNIADLVIHATNMVSPGQTRGKHCHFDNHINKLCWKDFH